MFLRRKAPWQKIHVADLEWSEQELESFIYLLFQSEDAEAWNPGWPTSFSNNYNKMEFWRHVI